MASETRTWEAGGGRRMVLAFAVLLLLPFYVSLGPMLAQRASRGLIGDTLSLLVLALAFSIVMALILQQLVHAVRTRIKLTATGIEATVPRVGPRGPFFLWQYDSRTIPYGEIASVESRNEVYGGALAPVLLTSTRIVPKAGPPLVLGYTNANDATAQLPFPEIGREVAQRAAVAVVDNGTVRRSLGKRVVGLTASAEENVPLPAAELDQLRSAHRRNIRALVCVLAALVLGGIGLDIATASRTSFATMGAGLSSAETGAVPVPGKKR